MGEFVKINEKTGEVKARLVLKKNKVTRRWRVKYERTDKRDKIDSRFDTRRSPFKLKKLHPRNIGVIYLYGVAWVLFSLWVPSTWLTWLTHRSVINQQSILIVVALGLLVPLSAGVFDLQSPQPCLLRQLLFHGYLLTEIGQSSRQ